jgi:hypothetical protein
MGSVGMKSALLFAMMLVAEPLVSQTLPEAPKPHLDRIDWTLLASDAGARALDGYSTLNMLKKNNHEKFLPGFVVRHAPALAAFEGGMLTLNYFAARNLARHHHPMLAKLVIAADVIQVYPWAIHNLTMPACRESRPFGLQK